MLNPDRPIDKIDLCYLLYQVCNFLPYLAYILAIVWNLDGAYWLLEDFAPAPKYRSVVTTSTFLLIRTFLLIPGFLETCRTTIYSSIGYMCVIIYLKTIIQTLAHKVRSQSDFFRYYSQLYILSNVLGPSFEMATFIICSVFYFFFVQTLWICVCGFRNLDLAVYLFFASYAFVVLLGAAIFLPIVACAGEVINDVRRIKLKQIENIYCSFRTTGNKVKLKKAVGLRSIRFSYGSYYPLGKKFSRNIFDNVVQHLLSMVLLFDLSGKRH